MRPVLMNQRHGVCEGMTHLLSVEGSDLCRMYAGAPAPGSQTPQDLGMPDMSGYEVCAEHAHGWRRAAAVATVTRGPYVRRRTARAAAGNCLMWSRMNSAEHFNQNRLIALQAFQLACELVKTVRSGCVAPIGAFW